MSATNQAKNTARSVTNEARPWVVFLARLGYFAKGIVYFVIGLLALKAAYGVGNPKIQPQDALNSLVTQPFGRVLLWIVAIGLVGYVLWMFVRALMDPEHKGNDLKGLVIRGADIVSGIGYGIIAATAFQILLTSRQSSSGSGSIKDWTAKAMQVPFGRWAIGIVGLIIIGVGIFHFYRAYKADFMKELQRGRLDKSQKELIRRIGQIGITARGIVYLVIGIFLAQAAWTYNPNKAAGLGEALQAIARQPYGAYLLGFVAVGLIAYGIYAMLLSMYRRIYVPAV